MSKRRDPQRSRVHVKEESAAVPRELRVPVLMKEEAEQAPIDVPVLVTEDVGHASIFIPEVASAPRDEGDEAEETEGRELVIADEGAVVERERALAEATTVEEVNDLAAQAQAEAARRYLRRSRSALKK